MKLPDRVFVRIYICRNGPTQALVPPQIIDMEAVGAIAIPKAKSPITHPFLPHLGKLLHFEPASYHFRSFCLNVLKHFEVPNFSYGAFEANLLRL